MEPSSGGLAPLALRRDFHVVGIGAGGDGGRQALEEFFRRVPADGGLAFIVMLRGSQALEEELAGFLARQASLVVHRGSVHHGADPRASASLRVEADSIHLVPQGLEAAFVGGRLRLTDATGVPDPDLRVDRFMQSLATGAGRSAVAVVLSGSDDDGARGLLNVHEAGGLVLVQAPESAGSGGRPSRADANSIADFVLAPDAIADVLVGVLRRERRMLSRDTNHRLASPDARSLQSAQEDLALFKYISDFAREAEILVDEGGHLRYVNGAACRKLGRTHEELLRSHWSDVVSMEWPALVERVGQEASCLLETTTIHHGTVQRPQRFLEFSASTLRFRGRRYYFASLRDVTARKEAERTIRIEHAVSRILAEMRDLDGAIAAILEEFCRVFGLFVGEWWVPREGSLELKMQVYGPSAPAHEAWSRASRGLRIEAATGLLGRIWVERSPRSVADVRDDPGFQRREVAESLGVLALFGLPVFVGDECLAVLGFFAPTPLEWDDELFQTLTSVCRSIEQFARRARVEEALKLRDRALREARDGIVIVDARAKDEPIVNVNGGFERLTGYSPAEVIGRNCRFLQGPGTDPAALAKLREAVRRRQACRLTLLNYDKEGRPFWNDLHVSPVHDDRGEVTHLVGIQHDVSAQKKAEEELRAAQSAAEAANRAKSEFLANVSHEIRTPMAAIMGFADILLDRLGGSEGGDDVRAIKRNGAHLVALIDDILDLSQIESGHFRIDSGSCSLVELLGDVESMMHVRAQERGVSFSVEFVTDVPLMIRTDRVRLRQILVNLIGNALKFTDVGGVRVTVGYVSGTVPSLEFQVIDTGIGIATDELEQIFDPFWQARRVSGGRRGGAGLGLNISRRLARRLGGDIEVVTEVGRGSTFTLRVPAGSIEGTPFGRPDSLRDAMETARSGAAAAGTGSGMERRLDCRVLVADDQVDVRRVAAYLLERAGALVSIAAGGKELLTLVAEAEERGEPFDLLLVDMMMPGISGEEAVSRLRAGGFKRPVIAMTASAMKEQRARWSRAGCDEVIAKPIAPELLIGRVADLCARAEAAEGPLRVLVVEDDPDAAEALRRLLARGGAQVDVAHTGAAALEYSRALRPDLVLADLRLPDIDGTELIAPLRKQLADAAPLCVALSGFVDKEDVERALQAGFDLHLAKPVDPARLGELLVSARRRSRSRPADRTPL